MRLWTWQNKDFDISGAEKVDWCKSLYLNDPQINEEMRKRFRKTYEALWMKLGTDQFHWYFADEQDAKSDASHTQYENRNAVLWEIDIPSEKIFKKICSVAWNILLGQGVIIRREFDMYWRKKAAFKIEIIEQYERDFIKYWESKTKDELWKVLFLNGLVPFCTQILLKHPINSDYIIKNPIELGKWWTINKIPSRQSLLSCEECLSRRNY